MPARTWTLERWLLAAAGVCLAACLARNLGVVTPILPRVWDKAYNGAEYLSIAICGLRALPRPWHGARRVGHAHARPVRFRRR